MAGKQSTKAPKSARPPQRDRRTEILASAARVITERGLSETRVADIATDAGVSTGLVLYYFDSKDKLLSEALAQLNDRFYLQVSRELRSLGSARDRLEHLIDLSVPDRSEEDRVEEWALWIEVWVRALRDPQMAREREVLDRRFRDALAEVIRGGQASGEFPRGTEGRESDPDELALRLSALIDGLAIQTVLGDTGVTPTHMKRAALQVAAREIGFEA